MNINLISYFINNISKNDLNNFFNNQKIYVNEEEFDYLYKNMKEKYKKIINNDINTINEIKLNINKDAFDKLYNLYIKYKK